MAARLGVTGVIVRCGRYRVDPSKRLSRVTILNITEDGKNNRRKEKEGKSGVECRKK